MNAVLIGYRGTGKSSVGRLLAEMLGLELVETDAEIVRRAGMTIPEIVEKHSWEFFRDIESEVIADITDHKNQVVDCGGGVVTRPRNIEYLQNSGVIFLLEADPDDIIHRIRRSRNRPSLTGDKSFTEEVIEVMKEREPLYRAAADYVINTSSESPRTAAQKIAVLYRKIRDA